MGAPQATKRILTIRSSVMLRLCSRGRYRVALEEFFSQYKDELSADSINRYVTMPIPLAYAIGKD